MTDEDTVVRLEKQVAITGNEYNKLNDQYILAVNNFTEEKKNFIVHLQNVSVN